MVRIKLVVHSLAILALTSVSVSVMAKDTEWYAGASLGQSKAKYKSDEFRSHIEAGGNTGVVASVGNNDTAWKLFGGYKFNRHFGIEAGYVDLGTLSEDATYATPIGSPYRASTSAKAYQLSVVGTVSVSERASIFGKVGMSSLRFQKNAANTVASENISTTGSSPSYGLGVNVNIYERIGLRVEWERIQGIGTKNNIRTHDFDLLSVGAVFQF